MRLAKAQESTIQWLLLRHNVFFTLRNVKFNVYFYEIYERY